MFKISFSKLESLFVCLIHPLISGEPMIQPNWNLFGVLDCNGFLLAFEFYLQVVFHPDLPLSFIYLSARNFWGCLSWAGEELSMQRNLFLYVSLACKNLSHITHLSVLKLSKKGEVVVAVEGEEGVQKMEKE